MTPWQQRCLQEMGLAPVWRLRSAELPDEVVVAEAPPAVVAPPAPPQVQAAPAMPPAAAPRRVALPPPVEPALAAPPAAPFDGPRAEAIARMDWDALEASIRHCQACRLHAGRNKAVPGVGDRQARWLFVGEGPGAEEDRRGEPFVGAAGQLLDNMLAALGLKRGEGVYIANTVKCRPPNNRDPEPDEMAACHPYLERQIELLQPRIIVALGRPAAQALLERQVTIREARGRRFERAGIPLLVTYHPAYLLRNPEHKGRAWEDLCLARRLMAQGGGQG